MESAVPHKAEAGEGEVTMCMKNSEEGCVLSTQQKELAERVDKLEKQMVEVQAIQKQMRSELQQGFADLKTQIGNIYEERKEWSKWMRENLPKAAKWVGKWIVILTGVAIGVSNLRDIVAVFGVK